MKTLKLITSSNPSFFSNAKYWIECKNTYLWMNFIYIDLLIWTNSCCNPMSSSGSSVIYRVKTTANNHLCESIPFQIFMYHCSCETKTEIETMVSFNHIFMTCRFCGYKFQTVALSPLLVKLSCKTSKWKLF